MIDDNLFEAFDQIEENQTSSQKTKKRGRDKLTEHNPIKKFKRQKM